ncbi:MAG: tryptophan synthase alpha chain [Candidatus Binatota bacterium]|nr:tryptophan synthase alpha chain [Candidatus Binatota bacterium]
MTLRLLGELERAGADLIELGVPFSDPMADGPVLQRAAERALRAGTTLRTVLDVTATFRRGSDVPLVLFGYTNPYLRYGPERFARDAREAGADGVLCIDLPPEESAELEAPLRENGLDLIRVLAPTSTLDRMRTVLRGARGFVYFVSVAGVTGARTELPLNLEQLFGSVRRLTRLPVGVGFGISTPEQAAGVAAFADAVIVGSAIARRIEEARAAGDVEERVVELVSALGAAVHGARERATP